MSNVIFWSKKILGLIMLLPMLFIIGTFLMIAIGLFMVIAQFTDPAAWQRVGQQILIALISLAGIYVAAGLGEIGWKWIKERKSVK